MPDREHVFTPDQIEAGIARALEERELTMVPGLVRLLAVQDPHRAGLVLEALQGRVTFDLTRKG